MTNEEIVKMAEVEHRAKSNTRRIEKLEVSTEALEKLATSVELLVAEQRHQTEAMLDIKSDVAKLDQKVETLEKKPAKRWEGIVEKIILTVVGAIIGYLMIRVGLS